MVIKELPVEKKKKRLSKKWLLLFVVLALAGVWFFTGTVNKKSEKNIEIVTPQKSNINENVTAQGKLEPKEFVDVGAQVSGQLKKVYFEIGDVVKKGELIAEIDPKVYQSRVAADEARLKTLNAQLAEQEAQVVLAGQQNARNEKLIAANAISKEEMETSVSELKAATARTNSIRAQIEEANSTLEGDRANLSYTKIYSPMDGTIVSETTKEGQTINANQTAPVIVQVANLDVMTIRAQVAEADVMRLQSNMNVEFTTLGATERKWKATVRQILPSPEVINDVVLYNALIDVDNKDRELMTGMSVQVFFLLGNADNVITVPIRALGKRVPEQDNKSGEAYMIKLQDGTEKTIWVGLMNRNEAEVKAGLTEADQIEVVAPPSTDKKQQGAGFRGGPRI